MNACGTCGHDSSTHADNAPGTHCTVFGCKCRQYKENSMSHAQPSTKVERLRMRATEIEDKLARLLPDVPGEHVEHVDEALRHVRELLERLR